MTESGGRRRWGKLGRLLIGSRRGSLRLVGGSRSARGWLSARRVERAQARCAAAPRQRVSGSRSREDPRDRVRRQNEVTAETPGLPARTVDRTSSHGDTLRCIKSEGHAARNAESGLFSGSTRNLATLSSCPATAPECHDGYTFLRIRGLHPWPTGRWRRRGRAEMSMKACTPVGLLTVSRSAVEGQRSLRSSSHWQA